MPLLGGAQKSVIKPQLARPGRVQVTSCTYSPDGGMIAGGVTDGSIQLFPSTGTASYRSASVGLVLPPTAQCHVDNNWTYASRWGWCITPLPGGVSDWLHGGPYRLASIEPCFDCKIT